MFSKRNYKALFAYTVIAAALFGGGFFLTRQAAVSTIKNGFFTVTYPFQKTLKWSASNVLFFFKTFSTIKDLAVENKKLKIENLRLFSENALYLQYKKENELLRAQLGLEEENKDVLIFGNIIGTDPQYRNSQFIIDRGRDDGVEEGMLVSAAGMLIGNISEVYANSSKATLLYNSDTNIGAVVRNSEGEKLAEGIVKHDLNLGLFMEAVSKEKQISIGDTVVDSESRLIIGTISEITGSDVDVFQKLKIKPLMNYDELEAVFISK